MKKNKIVIVMPAYNAEKTIEKTYYDIPKTLRDSARIILVDDKSSDKTVSIARKLGLEVIRHHRNLGYGANQKTCYKHALKLKPDIVVMIHPDYQYDSSLTEELIRPLQDGWLHIMLGNRIRSRIEALEGGMPLYKYLGNRFLTFIENIILGLNLAEYHTGFRAYQSKVLKSLPLEKFSDDFVFDQEILIAATHAGYRIGEIPVPVRYFAEASSIDFAQSLVYGIMTVITLFKYVMHRLGIYPFPMFKHHD
ncbi:glycosyl transferase family 2 [Candidatus Roizmanbacteria bacterium RIFCSPHIGHO2_02_FULL_37_24]|uniref:Glycosyl transferase family 2 n=1 Tax=Candidatus Roizmanbacteria bacterium RIFCSPHIGHO2_02_FULL_37_24 TaxID=1802037 RepID=A0A1F7GXH0_9BACT|nr:MAG: glycosyl transferase family 2 [Candidatus Roizmanbacteria bacterium RIFCSPHIGHO2_02_FULL_37_24]